MRVATFFPTPYGSMLATYTYETSMRFIGNEQNVQTTQMCLLNKVKGYDVIRIVEGPGDVIEIVNNHDGTYSCDRTDRTLRRVNSFFHLWENGEFRRDKDGNDANDNSDGCNRNHHCCDQHQVSYDELGTTLSDLYGIWQDGEESESRGSESAHKMTKTTEIGELGEHVRQLEHDVEMWHDRAEDMRIERDELQEKNRRLAEKCDAMLVLLGNGAKITKSDQEQRIEKLVRQRDELRVKLKEIGDIVNG